MQHAVNDNENVIVKTSNNNINDNDNKYAKAKKVDYIADKLLEKLKLGSGSRDFMLKVAWRLPESTIWSNVEQATMKGKKVTNPVGLFIYLCKRDGV